jgi:hypothetical protein
MLAAISHDLRTWPTRPERRVEAGESDFVAVLHARMGRNK